MSDGDVRSRGRAPRLWLIAAAALAALALAWPWMKPPQPPDQGIALGRPTLVGERRVRLTWQAVEGAPRYLVEVKSLDLVPRFNGTSETASLDLPFDVSREVLTGDRFVWSVTQVGEDGRPVRRSAVEPLEAPAH